MKIKNIEITHPDKLLFPENAITKKEVCEYYARIADFLLPFVKERPLTLRRYPDGIDSDGFYNKHAPDYFPDFIQRLTVPMEEAHMQMVAANTATELVYLAGQNTIEFHMALSKIDDIKKPDQLIFDFDPSDGDFEKVRTSALILKELLDSWDVPSFVKTTGSRGVHVHIPIIRNESFKETKLIAKKIAAKLHAECKNLTTLEQRKNKRGDKVFIDYLRNDYAMTAIVPYSLRAHREAPIATPIEWVELADKSIGPKTYHIKNIFLRLAKKKDPWENFMQKSIKIQKIDK